MREIEPLLAAAEEQVASLAHALARRQGARRAKDTGDIARRRRVPG